MTSISAPPVLDAEAAARQCRALLGDALLEGLIDVAADIEAIRAKLRPLREQPGVTIVSVAVNGERVDAAVRGGGHEWRVVFGTAEGSQVGRVSVFRRPRRRSQVSQADERSWSTGHRARAGRRCSRRSLQRTTCRGSCPTSRSSARSPASG